MKRVLTFSLWGNNETYTIGAIKNAEIALHMYPEFECWFYIHKETVHKEILDELQKMSNVHIVIKTGDLNICKPMMWRYEAIDDPNVEVMMPRDTDTRILLREKLAVYDWLASGKSFHIMRDHPDHAFDILGGMFGTRKLALNWKTIMDGVVQNGNKMYDQLFLKEFIYDCVKDDAMIHATFHKYEPNCMPFPIPYDSQFKFVGEYVYDDNSRSQSHTDALKQALANEKIHLITSFYIVDRLSQRNAEIVECLYRNLKNPLIDKIHLYVDNVAALNEAIKHDVYNKIVVVDIGKQPTYYDMFKYSIDVLSHCMCMISNSDIYLYKCDMNVLNQLGDSVFALSRHESNMKCEVLGWGSHDAFIFKPRHLNYDNLQGMHHVQNVAGSDDNVVNILCDAGMKLYNPCFEIVLVHLHSSNYRTYDGNKIAHGKYFIKQEYFMKTDDEFVFYAGVDHIGDDVEVYKNSSIAELKQAQTRLVVQ